MRIGKVHPTGRACFIAGIYTEFLFRSSKDRAVDVDSSVTSNKNVRSEAKEDGCKYTFRRRNETK